MYFLSSVDCEVILSYSRFIFNLILFCVITAAAKISLVLWKWDSWHAIFIIRARISCYLYNFWLIKIRQNLVDLMNGSMVWFLCILINLVDLVSESSLFLLLIITEEVSGNGEKILIALWLPFLLKLSSNSYNSPYGVISIVTM